MVETLIHGQRFNLSKYLNETKQLRIEISYELEDNYSLYGSNILISAFGLNEDKKFLNKAYLITSQNIKSPCNGITFYKNPTEANKFSFLIDFVRLSTEINNIIFVFSLENNASNDLEVNYQIFKKFEVAITDIDKNIFFTFPIPLEFSLERTFEIFELYNRNFEWKALAQYYGYVGGLKLLAEKYGLLIDEFPIQEKLVTVVPKEINETLARKTNSYKEKLLDLSKRNPLINLQLKSVVEFSQPSFEELFTLLVETNKTLTIVPKLEEEDEYYSEQELVTNKTKKELSTSLYKLKYRATTSIEEQGVNILFMAFGLLTWSEVENSKDKFISPIILVPVELQKVGLNSPYKVKLLDDEIITNPALKFKLNNQFGLNFPELPEDFNLMSIKDYFIEVQNSLKDIPNVLLENKVKLGIFSFNKLVLYNDLEIYEDLIQSHPLLNGKAFSDTNKIDLSECKAEVLDTTTSSLDYFQVLDADSSQQEAIALAKKGVSFVLQGPPGTGKSQTITNIISECIDSGKSILFVSEKMAALEVVKKRLDDAKLGSFCLEIHSNKASKVDILQSLEHSLKLQKKELKKDIEAELIQLDALKEDLNVYIKTLHKPFGLLAINAYEAQAQAVKLSNSEFIVFSMPKLFEITSVMMNKIKEKLKNLASLTTVLPNLEENPWNSISLTALTIERETLIKNNLETLINISTSIKNLWFEYEETLKLKKNLTLAETKKWLTFIAFMLTSNQPLLSWLAESFDSNSLLEKTIQTQKEVKAYKELKNTFLLKYSQNLLKFDLVTSLKTEHTKLSSYFGIDLKNRYEKDYTEIDKLFNNFTNYYVELEKHLKAFHENTTVMLPTNFIELKYLFKLLALIEQEPNVDYHWFDENTINNLLRKVTESKTRVESLVNKITTFSQKYHKDLLELDIPNLLLRFETNYNSFFKRLGAVYKVDLKQITELLNVPKLTYIEALDILKKAELVYKDKKAFEKEKNTYINLFGTFYKDENTNWQVLTTSLESLLKLIKWFPDKKVPDKLKTILIDGGLALATLKQTITLIQNSYNKLTETLSDLEAKKLIFENYETFTLLTLKETLAVKADQITKLYTFYTELADYLKEDTWTWETLENDFDTALKLINYEKTFETTNFKEVYQELFEGWETNWDKIIEKITWSNNFKANFTEQEIINIFAEKTRLLEAIANKDTLYIALENFYKQIKKDFILFNNELENYLSLFINKEVLVKDKNLLELDILAINTWFVTIKEKFYALHEWFIFKEIQTFFETNKMPDFIPKLSAKKLSGEKLIQVFNKRFYLLWLDNIYEKEPLLSTFLGTKHNQLIEEFTTLDLKALEFAKARLQIKLRNQIPQSDLFEMQTSEIGILNTELTKKRKHKPLRRLFGEIQNTIFKLKPCFMMSPLSVAQFIDPRKIKFDVVIFDEASQIFPEDALGAILRAKQAIIVGDKKQMPPSNFFKFVSNEEGEEYDEDEAVEYESILDEYSNMGIPTRMLEWHYRSKDESLIAFSNKHFYDNRLYTFPNSDLETRAFEFIKVDGVYDRGGSRQNRIEAIEVAKLVFEHFKKYKKKRSLGVITFNEAQQMAILSELERKRLEDTSLEAFFEAKDSEKFFVKNIENVQGDERDVIIFSIGYGKDQNNKFSYNFGVLNQKGGERRLNVAITRARTNIKIVSSISYTDMDLGHLKSKGGQLLRNYLEYAERGKVALFEELKVVTSLDFDSPFEEHVYNELSSLGYEVRTQVGSSGYRIDLALVDPEKAGQFLLGIECDGATYHSSKTARDRDRLRQQILEGVGWKIHRIWSRDWLSDPKNELLKIQALVESIKVNNKKQEAAVPITKVEELLNTKVESATALITQFPEYFYTKLLLSGEPEDFYKEAQDSKIAQAIYQIVKTESPVALNSVIKRVIAAWNMSKAGSKIQKRLKDLIKNMDNYIKLDQRDFLWQLEMTTPKVRIPGEIREMEDICIEEFAEALLYFISKSYSADKEELIKITAKFFNFSRTSSNLRDKINQAIALNINKGKFLEEGTLIKLKE